MAWGYNGSGQITVPVLPAGLSYTQVAAGWTHTVALRSDGSALAWGDNLYGQTTVPGLPAGLSYTQVSAGQYHSVALRSDGSVVAWGRNNFGQIVVPGLPAGQSYTQVSAGQQHTVALLALPNAFMVAAVGASPVGVPITYALSTQNPPAPFAIYLLDVSFAGSAPGIALPGSGVIPLNPPFLFIEYGAAFPFLFSGFFSTLDASGMATASFNAPNVAVLVGLTLSAASVTANPLAPFGIGRISNGVSTLFTL